MVNLLVHRPEGSKLCIVDDASDEDYVLKWEDRRVYRFDKNVGIARAKNKCFELLDDCDHIFLFDDDTYPVVDKWWVPYIDSGEPHLMYIFQDFATGKKLNDNILLYQDGKLRAWSHPRGVMCYFRKECLQKVGGMDPAFGKWGWEHPQLSDRIFNAGLTKYRYADVVGSEKLFYSADEHQAVDSTVSGKVRAVQIQKNKAIYEQKRDSVEYIPYKQKQNIVLTCYFTQVSDPQRGTKWKWDAEKLQPLIGSMSKLDPEKEKLVILHDFKGLKNLTAYDCHYVETSINPYFQRWLSYYEYLTANRDSIDKVFCVDATDVEMLKNPFSHMQPGKLYTGDEPGQIACEWMVKHHRQPQLLSFFKQYGAKQIANAGLLGGEVDTVIAFCKAMVDFYMTTTADAFHKKQEGPGMTDMGAFNYIVYTKFGDKAMHGPIVNTRFKANERNDISWFRHK